MIDADAIDSVIPGCTELPLILDGDAFDMPFPDTTAIHRERIVNHRIEGQERSHHITEWRALSWVLISHQS